MLALKDLNNLHVFQSESKLLTFKISALYSCNYPKKCFESPEYLTFLSLRYFPCCSYQITSLYCFIATAVTDELCDAMPGLVLAWPQCQQTLHKIWKLVVASSHEIETYSPSC